MFINCLHILPPRQYPESLRQPPDTSQTLSRQPSDIPRHLGEKEPADQNYSNQIFINNFTSYPSPPQATQTISRLIQTTQDNPQKSSRHPTDTPKQETQWLIQGHREKGNQPIKTILNVPSLEFQQLIWHDNHPGSIQSHPDTLRTPFRHPPTHSRQPQIY